MKPLVLIKRTLITAAAVGTAIAFYVVDKIDKTYYEPTTRTEFVAMPVPNNVAVATDEEKEAAFKAGPGFGFNSYADFLALSEGRKIYAYFSPEFATYWFASGGTTASITIYYRSIDKTIESARYLGHGKVLIRRNPALAKKSVAIDVIGGCLLGALGGVAMWLVLGVIGIICEIVSWIIPKPKAAAHANA